MSIHKRLLKIEQDNEIILQQMKLLTENFEERLGQAIDHALGELELISMTDIDRKREIELMEKLQKEVNNE